MATLEDVPVIVPIVLALLIFFGSLSWAIQQTNAVNDSLDLFLGLMGIMEIFTQGNFLTNKDFTTYCNMARDQYPDYGFIVALVDVDTPVNRVIESKAGQPRCEHEAQSMKQARNVLVRAVPVVYQEMRSGIPYNVIKKLVVGVWKRG